MLPAEGKTLWVAWGLTGGSSHRDVVDRNAVGSDVVDLAGRRYVDQVVGLNLDLVPRRQESVKTHDEVGMALKELRHAVDDSWSVDAVETEGGVIGI